MFSSRVKILVFFLICAVCAVAALPSPQTEELPPPQPSPESSTTAPVVPDSTRRSLLSQDSSRLLDVFLAKIIESLLQQFP